ncbi:MAG: hypothetical protein NUV56_01350, partial [Candidatus Uhrbacteria bacterium]|nr:hypothetical protein [Candidatus Uhrbacteria bacterium]
PDTVLGRLVLSSEIDPLVLAMIRNRAEMLGIPVIIGDTKPQEHDFWLCLEPKDGWGELAGKVPHTNSVSIVYAMVLDDARVVVTRWALELRHGGYFQNLEADHGGPVETAMKFETEQEAWDFMKPHFFLCIAGAMAKEVVVASGTLTLTI